MAVRGTDRSWDQLPHRTRLDIEDVLVDDGESIASEWDGARDAGDISQHIHSQPDTPYHSGHSRVRHFRGRPPLVIRVAVLLMAIVSVFGLVGTAAYRIQVGQITKQAHAPVTSHQAPPVITLFSPSGDPPSQSGGDLGNSAPLPVTSTQAPSQYLAPDKASDYELSLIANIGTPDKAIVVSRLSQTIHVYQSGQFIAGSYAITGRPELPTPIGVYHIFLKIAPAVLYSPWPPSSPYYYAPAPVNYTMEFREGGFLIHDAPWHHIWGPGMNDWHYDPVAKEWQWGTHGCVTAPTPFIQWLYNWSPEGTTVIIY